MLRFSIALLLLSPLLSAQEGSGPDDKILARGEKLLEEAKAAYEDAKAKSSVPGFVDAGFKLEEARIKFIVLQEIGTPERQKISADRLRAINQLGKLIHDGKVAISGTPGESKPSDPGAPEPAPKPAEEPVKMAADVTKRAAAPDAVKQRDAEKLVKDLFKDQYAKKAPADRLALAQALLDQAAKSADDPAILWVLFREAQDAAVQACDLAVAFKAIDASARVFDVDGLALRSGALQGALKIAKSPAECSTVASASLRLADDMIAADQYDAADKATAAAVSVARKGNDAALVAKIAQRNKEIAEARSRYQALRSVLETLAKNPEDPAANNEMGQFLCFVKSNWDLGTRFLLKGSDPALKTLAEKEVAMPTQALDQVALADGWWELSEKEKSPLRKSQMQSHAKLLYEGALPSLTGLLLVKVERRL
ncbi:MAG TPA: hypothetical protein VMU54_20055, partial [Planctomycetota bacterium]|nr:hypothetical protein [Planctomycetota bacterium]